MAIPHSLGREEAARRLRERAHEVADFVPGGTAEVAWPSEDRMELTVRAMGKAVDGAVEVEERQVVFTVDFPPALSFVEPIIQAAIERKGRKLLS